MSERLDFVAARIKGLYVVRSKPVIDERGFFERLFCGEDFREIGFEKSIVQVNRSSTRRKGTVRGMHFQYPPHAETKIVSCLKGEVFDVAVDIRSGSPTFLQWHAEVLTPENGKSFLIPEGFAHGFQTVTDDCQMLYMHTAAYAPGFEGALNARDPLLNIAWPLVIREMSDRDGSHPFLTDQFEGINP